MLPREQPPGKAGFLLEGQVPGGAAGSWARGEGGLLPCDPGDGAAPPLRHQGLGTKKGARPGGLAGAVGGPAPGDGQSLCAQPIGRNGSRGPQPPGTRTCRRGCPQGGSSLDFQRVAGNPVRVDGGACASEGARGGRPGHSCPRPPGAGKPRETVGPVADSPWDLLPGAVPSV